MKRMAQEMRMAQAWHRATIALAFVLSLAGVVDACAAAELLYGGQVNAAGVPVAREGTSDPGGLPGSTPLAAQSGKLDLQRKYGGLRLSDSLTLEATQTLPYGDVTKSSQEGLSFAGKATLPLSDVLSISGKLGLHFSGSTLLAAGPGLEETSVFGPLYGLGFAYESAKGLELRVESEHVAARAADSRAGASDTILVGGRVRF